MTETELEARTDLLTRSKLAKLLDVDIRTIDRWRLERKLPIPFILAGKRPYWTTVQIVAWQRHFKTSGGENAS